MTVAVFQPQAKKSNLDTLQQALGIASNIYGVAMEKDKLDANVKANELQQQRQNKLDEQAAQDREINHLKDWAPAAEGDQGAVSLPGRQGLFLPRAITLKREEMAAKSKEDAAKANKEKGPQQLTAGAATEIGDLQSVNKLIDNLEGQYNQAASSNGSGIKSWFPGTDASKYLQNKKVATQAIGVVLEKGKMTDGDRAFYSTMMPDPWDPPSTAKAKINALRTYAKSKQEAALSGLKQANFDTSKVQFPSTDQEQAGSGDPELDALVMEKMRREARKNQGQVKK